MFNFFNKSDSEVQKDVMSALNWDPSLTSDDVTATAKDGIVTLRGTVPHYIEKLTAERAAQRVGGVKAVADELEVKSKYEKTDEEIAKSALQALSWNYSVPKDIMVTVTKGWIKLTGQVDWEYQRLAAQNAVSELFGVCGVTNDITIKSKALPSDIKTRIEDALKRSAESEGRKISVHVSGDKVTLSGTVHSHSEIEDAQLAAWCAPGVKMVQNEIKIGQ